MMKWISITATGCLMLACSGLPGAKGAPDVAARQPSGRCIPLAAVGGYRILDAKTILLDVGPSGTVIEVFSDCDGLRFAEDLLLEGRGGQVCDYRGDKLIVDGSRCTIASIRTYDVLPDIIQQPRLELNEEEFLAP